MNDKDKVSMFDSLLMSDVLDGLIRAELTVSYKLVEDGDWETKDAIRKVVKYYSSEDQYKEFEETYIERDS